MRPLYFEHPNPNPDIAFFSIIGVIIVVCVILYLLVPVFKRKQFAESRANLAKREATFRENIKRLHGEKGESEEKPTEATPVEVEAKEDISPDEKKTKEVKKTKPSLKKKK